MSQPTCATCQYWRPNSRVHVPGYGDCRRHAPRQHTGSGRAQWPHTQGEEDCGEYAPYPMPDSGTPSPTGKGPVGKVGADPTGSVKGDVSSLTTRKPS